MGDEMTRLMPHGAPLTHEDIPLTPTGRHRRLGGGGGSGGGGAGSGDSPYNWPSKSGSGGDVKKLKIVSWGSPDPSSKLSSVETYMHSNMHSGKNLSRNNKYARLDASTQNFDNRLNPDDETQSSAEAFTDEENKRRITNRENLSKRFYKGGVMHPLSKWNKWRTTITLLFVFYNAWFLPIPCFFDPTLGSQWYLLVVNTVMDVWFVADVVGGVECSL
jgi:hypothetical protein